MANKNIVHNITFATLLALLLLSIGTRQADSLGKSDNDEVESTTAAPSEPSADPDGSIGSGRSSGEAPDSGGGAPTTDTEDTKPPEANPNSGVEKGTADELPQVSSTGKPARKDGLVRHSDNPKTHAQKGTYDMQAEEHPMYPSTRPPHGLSRGSTPRAHVRAGLRFRKRKRTRTTPMATTGKPEEAEPVEGGDDESRTGSLDSASTSAPTTSTGATSTTKTPAPETTVDPVEAAESRASLDAIKSILSTEEDSPSGEGPGGNANGGASRASVQDAISSTAKPGGESKGPQGQVSVEERAKRVKELSAKGGELEKRKRRPIMVNGRKFDQVRPVECVDPGFYKLLMNDLQLVRPDQRMDFYGSYYDYEYAKTITALVETPQVGQTRSENISKTDTLAEILAFWNETKSVYEAHRAKLDKSKLPSAESNSSRDGIAARADVESQPEQVSALANYRYLLSRLEQLKALLLDGEEALIKMNNRVKKLNQAVGEDELQHALCSCITARAGRAALMMMNELFVDKSSEKLREDLEAARRRGREAALDTAEFCAYWYGDTIRSEVVQKERQIKKLVLQVAKHKKTTNETTVVTTTKVVTKNGKTVRETQTRVVTTIIQMTSLWLPKLANWIKGTLKLPGNKTVVDKGDHQEVEGKTTKTVHVQEQPTVTEEVLDRAARSAAFDDAGFSTPFDSAGTYADVDDPTPPESSSIIRSFIANSYPFSRRWRRDAESDGEADSTTAAPDAGDGSTTPAPDGEATSAPATTRRSKANKAEKALAEEMTEELESQAPPKAPAVDAISTTTAPLLPAGPTGAPAVESDFEQRISENSAKCASSGFAGLLNVAYDQNALMYESERIARDDKYVATLRDSFIEYFGSAWHQKRAQWSKNLTSDDSKHSRSIDEEIDNTFEATASAYERGAKLGFTAGKFVGEKAAAQWPDPAELNTFTYDSIFLAGVGHGYTEADSRELERHIVYQTALRVAFAEANRAAFAKALRSAYLTATFMAPTWGVLHTQRAVAAQAAKWGRKAGFDAAAQGADEFIPRARKFFAQHEHQRDLAAPYKARRRVSDKWGGVGEQLVQVQLQSELHKNISRLASDCGTKTGAVMGALVGLLIPTEAFESYARLRGSPEGLENEFNQYQLGAMRAYQLGETWAYLNYTAQVNHNLRSMKAHQVNPDADAQPEGPQTTRSPEKEHHEAVQHAAATSLFENTTSARNSNTDNFFQFMVLNYGSHLVANHSRANMLKLRTLVMDEKLVRDMQVQAGDLVAQPSSKGAPEAEPDGLFEPGAYVGELKGEFNSLRNAGNKPLKFNVIDLGTNLEMADEVADKSNQTSRANGLENTPLTAALSKLSKIFMKFSVARRKRQKSGDDVSRYLNANFDEGDGYLTGTFSRAMSRLSGAQRDSPEARGMTALADDFSGEVTMLDELFERIEQAAPELTTVQVVERLMGVTTVTPNRAAAVAESSTTLKPVLSTSAPASPKSEEEPAEED